MAQHSTSRSKTGLIRRFLSSYGLDERSLALFRIALGSIVLIDLIRRFQHSTAMYTDRGIFSREFLLDSLSPDRWSLLFINGSEEFVNIFFLASFAVTIAFILGWKTRLVSVLLWVVIISIQYRNTHLQNGADTLIRVTSFWAMFLPLGRCWSIDSYVRPVDRQTPSYSRLVLSVATFALILQNAIMYLVTAMLKNGPRWHEDGTALFYALGARQITTGFGEWIFHQSPEWLLTASTYGTLVGEFMVPILLLIPIRSGWVRTTAVGMICGLHFGILTTMTVGFFPVISIAIGLAVLPAWFWDTAMVRVITTLKRFEVYNKVAALPERLPSLPRTVFANQPAPINETMAGVNEQHILRFINRPSINPRDIPGFFSNIVCAFAILGMLAWNIQSVSSYEVPPSVTRAMVTTGLYQSWSMFAPGPPTMSTWIIVQGTLESGEKVDLLLPIVQDDMSLRLPVNADQRDQVDMQDKYWRKFFQSAKRDKDNLTRFAAYTCRTWNAENSGTDRLARVTVAQGQSRTLDDRERDKPVFDQLGSWKCS